MLQLAMTGLLHGSAEGLLMCPQKNAVLLGGNKTDVCAGLQVTKSKTAQGPNDVEYSNSVLKSTSAVADV